MPGGTAIPMVTLSPGIDTLRASPCRDADPIYKTWQSVSRMGGAARAHPRRMGSERAGGALAQRRVEDHLPHTRALGDAPVALGGLAQRQDRVDDRLHSALAGP